MKYHLKSIEAVASIFQHENNPKHSANAVKGYLGRKTQNKNISHGSASPGYRPQYEHYLLIILTEN